METELFDINAPEGPTPQPETPERPDVELYLDQIAALRDMSTRELIARRAFQKSDFDDREARLKALQIQITPAKWEGSNETERSTSREKHFAGNKDVQILRTAISMAKYDLDMIDAELEARADERKTAEFKLREREANQRERDLVLREAELEARMAKPHVADQFRTAKQIFDR